MEYSSLSHLVLIPSYNTGAKLIETVRDARRYWRPVWVVVDGSTDGTARELDRLAAGDPHLCVFTLPRNRGKGAAILHGLRHAEKHGFTHVLTMDADGQHPAGHIPDFMAISRANPGAQILGKPIFDSSAPRIRVNGRKLSNWCAHVETLGAGIGDSLFGFRVYPIRDLRSIMESTRWMRRFDFDAEAAVRLCWRGVRPINRPTPTRYFRPEEGGVSHFNYVRDNILLTWMHVRLSAGFLRHVPAMVGRRVRSWRR